MVYEPQSRRILKPVKPGFVMISLVVAIVFNSLPWRDMRGVPDLVALVLAFWCVHQPRLIGFAIPFLCGLLMDASIGVILGQHALGYSVLAFVAQALSRRMMWFSTGRQAVQVFVLLVFVQALMLAVRLATPGGTFPGWSYFAGSAIAALLWPLVTFVLLAPQRAANPDETATL